MFETIEKTVKQLQQIQTTLAEQLDMAAIEALVVMFELLLGQTDEEFETLPMAEQTAIKTAVAEVPFDGMTTATKRQVLQLLLVATIREDGLQANYQVTPDAIGMWLGFLAEQFVGKNQAVNLMDLTTGTGNLLATVQQILMQQGNQVTVTGVENDDTMITVASGLAALLSLDWQLNLQDAVAETMPAAQDLVIGDLPVGYYPAAISQKYVTQATEGLTYVHHLLIEKAVQALRPGGLAALIVPADLFDTEQAPNVLKFLQEDDVYFQALLQFPTKLFASPKAAKAILLLQKAGQDAMQATPVMLARTPELANVAENKTFVTEMTAWMTANHLLHE